MQHIVPEKWNLFDKARIMYRDKLLHGSAIQPVLVSSTHPVYAEDIQPQGDTAKTPGGYSPEIWVGVCGSVQGTLTLFQTKICDFP